MDRFDIIVFLDRLYDTHRLKEEREDAYKELLREFERLRGDLKALGVQQWVIDGKTPPDTGITILTPRKKPGDTLVSIVEPEGGPVTRRLRSHWTLTEDEILDDLARREADCPLCGGDKTLPIIEVIDNNPKETGEMPCPCQEDECPTGV